MKKRGQSLVEVTVALSLLGIAMFAVLTLAINVIGYSVSTKSRTQAVALAQEELEKLRAKGGCAISKNSDEVIDQPVSGAEFANFSKTITIADAQSEQLPADAQPPLDPAKYWYVTSKINWTVRGTPDGSVTVYGLISKN